MSLPEDIDVDHLREHAGRIQRGIVENREKHRAADAWADRHKVDVPEGVSGDWRVERFAVSDEAAALHQLREAINAHRGRMGVKAGTYTRLMRGGTLVMSDTQDEIADHLGFIGAARGRVLIHGLGLGMCAEAALRKPEVEHVLVVELSPDVVSLVGPTLEGRYGDRLEVRQGDAYTWRWEPGTRWDVVWHDIWDNISGDNLPEMHRLHRRFGGRCAWQDSWARYLCEQARDGGIW